MSLRVKSLKEGEGDRKQEGDLFECILSHSVPPPPPSIPYCDGEWGSMSSSYILYQRESTMVRRERKRSSVFHVVFLSCCILIRKNKVQPMFSVRGVFFGGLKAP